MAKQITRIVLTGGPAAGKTTLISRILKEFKSEDGWKVITVPETATELISGFGFGPFSNVMSMEDFQYFVVEDQLHKERLALRAAETVPEEKVLVIYDRAVPDDNAYVSDEHYAKVLARFGLTPGEIMGHYDAVLHLVSCAKGAERAPSTTAPCSPGRRTTPCTSSTTPSTSRTRSSARSRRSTASSDRTCPSPARRSSSSPCPTAARSAAATAPRPSR